MEQVIVDVAGGVGVERHPRRIALTEAGAQVVARARRIIEASDEIVSLTALQRDPLAGRLRVPLLAEGRYHTPEQVKQALTYGALAVIVGGAITRPQEITRRFVAALEQQG